MLTICAKWSTMTNRMFYWVYNCVTMHGVYLSAVHYGEALGSYPCALGFDSPCGHYLDEYLSRLTGVVEM